MSGYVSAGLRRLVALRADGLCEYCLIHEDDTFFGCQIEHVISEKHGGITAEDNLAYACVFCNRFKGTDIASLIPGRVQPVRLFNPRLDRWVDHFQLEGATIRAVTEVGEVTTALLQLNHPDRVAEREVLTTIARYPSAAAIRRMSHQS